MPSLEEQIAALANDIADTLALPSQVTAAAVLQVQVVGQEYEYRISNLTKIVYVNDATGIDTQPGTAVLPVKTIQKALELTPFAGRCRVILQGPIIVTQPIYVIGRELQINSDSSVRHAISFDRLLVTTVVPNLRSLAGFRIDGTASINFSGVRINIPALDGVWPGYSETNSAALLSWATSSAIASTALTFLNCDLDIPAAPYCSLTDAGVIPLKLLISAITYTGAVTSLNGRVIRGITSTAGTPPSDNLVTNLTAI